MRRVLIGLLIASAALIARAGARVVVQSLPEPIRPLAEAETNVIFNVGLATDNKWTLSIELGAAISNSVEIVFGCDADGNGVLGVDEGELCIGWDCGEWFWRDRRSNAACRVEGNSSRLDWTLYLGRERTARSLASSAFPSAVPPTCFNPEWDLARVVSRGAATIYVESKTSVDALILRIR